MSQTLLDLESMVDDVLDDFNESPDYINPPAGDYNLITKGGKLTKYENDDGEVSQSIVVTLAVENTLELVSDEEPPVANGSLFTIYYKGTVKGLEDFKRDMRKFSGASSSKGLSLSSAFELLESGLPFNARISYTVSKGRDGVVRNYLKLRVIPSVDAIPGLIC